MLNPLNVVGVRPLGWCVCMMGLCWTQAAAAEDYYYVTVFGAEQTPPRAAATHSFATFVKATVAGPSWAPVYGFESHTISPAARDAGHARPPLLPETGRNFDLHTTIRWALSQGLRISNAGALIALSRRCTTEPWSKSASWKAAVSNTRE